MIAHRSPIDAAEGGGAVLTRAVLNSARRATVHSARNSTKAQVYLLEWPAGTANQVVVKDVQTCTWLVRWFYGPWMLNREWRALQALEGISGVPSAVAKPDRYCIVMGFCPGRPLMELKNVPVDETVPVKVQKIVAEAHERGVTHGDLHRSNILVGEQNEVAVVDWATACVFGNEVRGLRVFLFNEWRGLDVRAVAKIKARHAPELLTEAEIWTLENGGTTIYRIIRQVGYFVRRLAGHKKAKSNSQSVDRYVKMAAKNREKRVASQEQQRGD